MVLKMYYSILMFLVLAVTTMAQVDLGTIQKGTRAKISVDLAPFKTIPSGAPAAFRATLQNDLVRSGYVSLGRPGEAAYALSGACSAGGGGLQADVYLQQVVSGQSSLSQRFTAGANEAQRLAHQVSDAIIKALTGQNGMAACRMVVVGVNGPVKELYLCDSDGGNLRQLTSDRTISMAPAWSPRGDKILYTSFLKGFADLYLIHIGNGQRERIANFSGLNMAGDIGPDGQDVVMVLSRDGNPELYIMDLAARKPIRLTSTRSGEASPSWSPDGARIVYAADPGGPGSPQLFVMGRSGSARQITVVGSENVSPDWGADGRIAYASRRQGHYVLMVYDPATNAHTPVSTDFADYEDPSWAPDGRHIVCARKERGKNSEIYILDIYGESPIRLALNGGNWRSPACSP